MTVAEALVRGYLVFRLPTQTVLAISPVVQYTLIGGAVAWTVWYARRARQRGQLVNAGVKVPAQSA